jgi:hypothetical protein
VVVLVHLLMVLQEALEQLIKAVLVVTHNSTVAEQQLNKQQAVAEEQTQLAQTLVTQQVVQVVLV